MTKSIINIGYDLIKKSYINHNDKFINNAILIICEDFELCINREYSIDAIIGNIPTIPLLFTLIPIIKISIT